ncbi:amino acid adenylation domain-containing protein [Serratia ureilytica]|uniref:non-ribosomal peptide synthetase n=1 Tax=Serratia ureilytica TaxID=300181 RepID=UPI0018D7A91A|nr:non-ribosomal peptide synthetase [Serratia ureilytica]MBH2663716.1 amino acid adenylation domain-containing protein [Serratia ureilytica]
MEEIPVSPYSKVFIDEYDRHPEGCNYNVLVLQRIEGALDPIRLQAALNALVQDHVLLNSHIHERNGELYWRRNDAIHPLQHYTDRTLLTQVIRQPFDIYRGPLYRWALFAEGPGRYTLALVGHHLVIDGASSDEFFSLVSQYYGQQRLSTRLEAAEIAAINRQLQREVEQLAADGALAHWRVEAANLGAIDVPFEKSGAVRNDEAAELRFQVPKAQWKALKQGAGIRRMNDFLALLVLWGILMARSGNQETVYISYPVSIKKGQRFALGGHVNTSVMPLSLRDGEGFAAVYQRALAFITAAAPHSRQRFNQLPTQQVVQALGIRAMPISFAQTNLRDAALALADCATSPLFEANHDMASASLSLEYEDRADSDALQFRLRFRQDMFDEEDMRDCAEHFMRLMQAAMRAPDAPLRHLAFYPAADMPPDDDAAPALPRETLSARFEAIALRYPDKIALEFEGLHVSYRELNGMANSLAREITFRYQALTGVAPQADTLIALYSEKSLEMVMALLAVLKTGAAYVPLSCNYPQARIRHILEETRAPVLIAGESLQSAAEALAAMMPHAVSVLTLGDLNRLPHERQNLPAITGADRLGAVIYTSGSTGTPKGVMLEQHAMCGLATASGIAVTPDDVLLFLSSPAFDAATFEVWGALLNGAKLVVVRDTEDIAGDVPQLEALLRRQQVSILWATRSLFDHLYLSHPDLFAGLRCLLVGGEALTATLMQRLVRQANRPQQVINGYGPTECTTFTTMYAIAADETRSSIPIGRAIPGRELHVLDRWLQPLPPGLAGELYIGGDALARGYLNQPQQTQERFITLNGRRLYKSGDRVRELRDGNLEYLGRNDCQVKIRGFRIELSEIENTINALEGVEKCVVVDVVHRDSKRLAAYVLMARGEPLDPADLRARLERILPDYMVPSSYVALDEIPLTVNGKLDRTALPAPQFAQSERYAAPQNALEALICALWAEILGVERVGVDDDFFRLGGDSIQSIVFTSELSKSGYHSNSRAVFETRNARALAKRILQQRDAIAPLNEQGELQGEFELLPIQRWYNEQPPQHRAFFNQTFLVRVPPMSAERVADLVNGLASRHDMLRARFSADDAGALVAQRYLSVADGGPSWGYYDLALCRQSRAELLHQWQSGFDPVEGPLCRFVYIFDSSAPGYALMFCAFHHLIIDVVSWRIIVRDMRRLHQGESLSAKGTSYRQWGETLRHYAASRHDQCAYWLAMIAGQPDYATLSEGAQSPAFCRLECDAALTTLLMDTCHQAYRTSTREVLLAALAPVLQAWHGRADSYLTLEHHGRDINDDKIQLDDTVGWFTALLPLRITAHQSPKHTLRAIKDTLRKMPDHGIGYSALKYGSASDDDAIACLRRHRLPAISFNYLGVFNEQTDDALWALIDQTADLENGALPASDNVLDLVLYVHGDRLSIVMSGLLPQATLARIGSHYRESVSALVEHCCHEVSQGVRLASPGDFPHADVSLAELDRWQQRHRIAAVFEATVTQRELMYFNRLNREYQIDQAVYEVAGPLQPEVLNQAWSLALQRFEMLRAGFGDQTRRGRPNVFICETLQAPIAIEDWTDAPPSSLEERMEALLARERETSFELDAPPLIRWRLIKLNADEYYLVQTFNHILFDGWSLGVLFEHWFNDYLTLLEGGAPALEINRFEPFAAYVRAHGDDPEAQAFWADYLRGAPVNQRLPLSASPDAAPQGRRMRQYGAEFTAEQAASLTAFCRRQGITVNQLTQLAWMLALAEALACDDIAIGTTMSERPADIEQVQTLFGLCVASPVLRLQAIRRRPIYALLADIADSQTLRQKYAFSELNRYDEQWVPTSPFGSLFVFENMPQPQKDPRLPFTFRVTDIVSGSNHQTVLCLFPEAERLAISLFYDSHEIAQETIVAVGRRFQAIAIAIAHLPPDSEIRAEDGIIQAEEA